MNPKSIVVCIAKKEYTHTHIHTHVCICVQTLVMVPIHTVSETRSRVGYVAGFVLGCVFHGLMRECHVAHHMSAGEGGCVEETGEPHEGNKGQGKMEGNSQVEEKVTAATLS